MGDRTNVEITVRSIDFDWLLRKRYGQPGIHTLDMFLNYIGADEFYVTHESELVTFSADEVNYGNWDELEDELVDINAEYDKHWGPGDEYQAGSKYVRLIDGKLRYFKVDQDDKNLLEFIEEILALFEDPSANVAQHFVKKYRKLKPFDPKPLDE